MLLYVSIFAVLIATRFVLAGQDSARRWCYPALLVALFLFSAYRYKVGCDWSGYESQFMLNRSFSWGAFFETREPLWWWTISKVRAAGLPYPWLNVITSLVFFVGVHVLARRQPDPFGFLVLLFPILIINMPMSGIRQGAAVGLMCIAFTAFVDRKLLRFLLCVFFASLIHGSAIVFLLLAPLVLGQYTRARIAFAVLLALPGSIALLSTSSSELAVSRYVATGVDAAGSAFRVGVLFISGCLFFFVFRQRWKRVYPADFKLVSFGSLLMMAAVVLVPISTVIGDRIAYYLIPIQSVVFARIPYLPLRSLKQLYSAAPYAGLFVMFLTWTWLSRHFAICYVPYDTWLFGLPSNALPGLPPSPFL